MIHSVLGFAARRVRLRESSTSHMRTMSSSSGVGTLLRPFEAHALAAGGTQKVVFVDGSSLMDKTRNAKKEYLDKHIPGAKFFDIDDVCDKSTGLPHMMPSEEVFAKWNESMDITNDTQVVVYTSSNCFSGPRVWYIYRAFGHKNVCLMQSGLTGWEKEGLELVSSDEMPTPNTVTPEKPYKATLNPLMVADLDDVKQAMQTGLSQILDARSAARFSGEAAEPRVGLLSGHMPGALNLPYTQLTEEGDPCTILPPNQLRDVLQENGVILGSRVISTCGSGMTAAYAALAMDLLGKPLEKIPIYDGSWTEYGSPDLKDKRADLPVVRIKDMKDM